MMTEIAPNPTLQFFFVDRNQAMVDAWRVAFAPYLDAGVTVLSGDIFQQPADVIVSPANSYGFMDGGIDAVYTRRWGVQVQELLQRRIQRIYDGELPVGQAIVVPTGDTEFPLLISAPTMTIPMDVSETANAYLAFRAVIQSALYQQRIGQSLKSIVCPGLGTGVGGMEFDRCAKQMLRAYERSYLKDIPKHASLSDAAFATRELIYH